MIRTRSAVWSAKFGTSGTWQAQIARALATWESVANINLVPVTDGSYELNVLGNAQSDPRFGDIRFGGYPFHNNTTTLAQTYFPPPNGSTAAGDVEVNTTLNFNINSTYDVYSVLLHETGHSLGLDHAKNPAVVMYPVYGGLRTGLTADDIAGIQAIYGARPLDSYQQQGLGYGFSSAVDVSAGLLSANQTGVSSVSLPSIGSAEYFSFVAPSYASGAIQVTVAAGNISMLSPEVTLYDAAGNQLAQAANPSAWSDNVTATVQGVVPGQRYYVKVTGATNDVFSVGLLPLADGLAYSIFYIVLLRSFGHPLFSALAALICMEGFLVCSSALVKKVLVGATWGRDHTAPFWSWRHFTYFFAQDCFFAWCRRPLRTLGGTVLANPVLRRMGCRIGRRTLLTEPLQAFDWNALSIGDDCVVGGMLQLHTFESMTLKVKRTEIQDGSAVNFGATVMGGAVLEPGTTLLPLSLVLKEMHLSAAIYEGSPAEPVGEAPPLSARGGARASR